MKRLTRILILILSVALVCSAFAVAISANTQSYEYTDENGQVQSAGTLAEALENVAENGTVTLKSNAQASEPLVIAKPMTLELNGYAIESTAGAAILVTAEGSVTVNGSGSITSAGAIMEIKDLNTENVAEPDVVIDGKAAGKAFGIEMLAGAEIFKVEDGCSLYVSAVDAKTTKATASTVAVGDGVYFGAKSSTFTVEDATAAPTGNYFINITTSAIIDLYDTNVFTTQNGFNAADGTLFVITVKGGSFICEGGNAAQTFFTAKNLERGIEAEVTIAASSVLQNSFNVIKASGKIFDTDFTIDTAKLFSANITDTRLVLSGDAETAGFVFGGAIPVYVGSGTAVANGNGAMLSASAKAAGTVTALPGSLFGAASADFTLPDGYSMVYDPVNSMVYPYTVGVASVGNYKIIDFETIPTTHQLNTPFASDGDTLTGLIQYNHFSGWLEFKNAGGNTSLVYHLPEFNADGTPVAGVKGYTCQDPNYAENKITYTAGASGQPGTVSVTQSNKIYMDLYFQSSTTKVSDFAVMKYSLDLAVDAEAGAPSFTFYTLGEKPAGSVNLGNPVFNVSGFNLKVGTATKTLAGGKYAHVEVIFNNADGYAHVYVDGEFVGSVNRTIPAIFRTTVRIYMQSGTYNENATLSIDNVQGEAIPAYTGGSAVFNADDYVSGRSEALPEYNGDITVNNVTYPTIESAYEAAGRLDSVVKVNAPLAAGEYVLPNYSGAIITNGYCDGASFISSASGAVITDANGNTIYHYSNAIYGNPVSVGWYAGTSSDPESDKAGWTNTVAGGGSAPSIPSALDGKRFDYNGYLYEIVGWTTEYFDPADYESVEEYEAAALAAVITEFETVTKEEGNSGVGRKYYAAYDLTKCLFKIERTDGTVNFFSSISEWNTIATTFITADREALDIGLRDGDVLTLLDNMTWNTGSAMQVGMMSLTIDLNGYTLNGSARNSMAMFTIGSSGAGNGNGNHMNAVGLTVISSRPGGAIIDEKPIVVSGTSSKNAPVFTICGSNKTLHVGGAGSYEISVKCATLLDHTVAASGNGSGCSVWLDGLNIQHIEPAKQNNVSYSYTLINYNGTGSKTKTSLMGFSIRNSKIYSTSQNWIVRVWDGEATTFRQTHVFENCEITLTNPNAAFARLDSAEHNLELRNTKLISKTASFGTITKGKLILSEGTVVPQQANEPNAYDSAKISNGTGTYGGVYYGASGIIGAIYAELDGITHVQVTKSQNTVTAVWKDASGATVKTITLAKGANFASFNPVLADTVLNTMTVSFAWDYAEGASADAPVFVPVVSNIVRTVASEVSVTLNTQLSVNVYVPVSVFEFVAEGSTVFDTSVTYTNNDGVECYRASIPVDTNAVFTGVTVTLNLSEGGFTSSKTSTISVVDYAKLVLESETLGAADKDLAYYMLTYISAAYDYMVLDDNPNAVAEIAQILAGYEPTSSVVRADQDTDASAIAGKLQIAVNLASTPEYIVKVLDQSITSINVNGTDYEVVNGLVSFSVLRINNFDDAITITVDGESGTYCLADYELAIGESNAKLAALIDALYDYVAYAKTYNP